MHYILDEACLKYTYIPVTPVSIGGARRYVSFFNSVSKFIFHFQGLIHIYVDSCKNLCDPGDPSYNASPMIEVACVISSFLITAVPVVQRKRNEEDLHQVLHKRSSHRAGLRPSQQKVRCISRKAIYLYALFSPYTDEIRVKVIDKNKKEGSKKEV